MIPSSRSVDIPAEQEPLHVLSSWGRFPQTSARILAPRSSADVRAQLSAGEFCGIARGLGRSYGDSALASVVMDMRSLDNLIAFDEATGVLECHSGVSLGEILETFAPRGWFLPVLPGTRHVTVGGAIASDVHGKNHHVDGSFTRHVEALELTLAGGENLFCSPTDNVDVFHATCGGMGLTGVITRARIKLRPVQSAFIIQESHTARDLTQCLELIDSHPDAHYSVAWLDCMARGQQLGRSLLFLGEHSLEGGFRQPPQRRLNVPVTTPALLLNRYSMSLFNLAYYRLAGRKAEARPIHYADYFFPLDSIANWNRLYGSAGFLQYQFVIPTDAAHSGISQVLERVTAAGKGSFLSVLKKFGPANSNLLSFPTAGFTLTLDFKFQPDLLPLLDLLDSIVIDHGGRLYLAKDARMSAAVFRRGYPRWEEFREVRNRLGAAGIFNSLQSRRLEI